MSGRAASLIGSKRFIMGMFWRVASVHATDTDKPWAWIVRIDWPEVQARYPVRHL